MNDTLNKIPIQIMNAYYGLEVWHSTGGYYPAFPKQFVPPQDGTVLVSDVGEPVMSVANPQDYFSAKYEDAGAWWLERAQLVRLPFGIIKTQVAPGTGQGNQELAFVAATREAAEAFVIEMNKPNTRFPSLHRGQMYRYEVISME